MANEDRYNIQFRRALHDMATFMRARAIAKPRLDETSCEVLIAVADNLCLTTDIPMKKKGPAFSGYLDAIIIVSLGLYAYGTEQFAFAYDARANRLYYLSKYIKSCPFAPWWKRWAIRMLLALRWPVVLEALENAPEAPPNPQESHPYRIPDETNPWSVRGNAVTATRQKGATEATDTIDESEPPPSGSAAA